MVRLVLASASPARTATLTAAGIRHTVRVSDVDEPATLAAQAAAAAESGASAPSPADQVLALARAKAEDVADRLAAMTPRQPRTLVLGGDSMLEADLGTGIEVVGKPGDPETAVRRWRAVRGTTGVLHSGHWLVDSATGEQGRAGSGPGSRSTAGAGDSAEYVQIPNPTGPRWASDPVRGSTGVGGVSSAVIHFADLTDAEIDAYVATGEPLKVAGGFTVDALGGPFVTAIEGDHHGVVGVSLPLLRVLLNELGVPVTDLWEPHTR